MSIDFALVFIIAAVICGGAWAANVFLLAPARAQAGGDTKEPVWAEYARSFFPIIVIVLVFRSFLYEPFRIPSDSMLPTLQSGDFILVNKFTYGLRWPVLNAKFVDTGSPSRGDVVVFRNPIDPSKHFIKRLIGLPGDKIEYVGKRLFINGQRIDVLLSDGDLAPSGPIHCPAGGQYEVFVDIQGRRYRVFNEQLDEVSHDIQLACGQNPMRRQEFNVPEGHYFMMGDNRDNSQDSRVAHAVGYVPEEYLVGRAVRIWMHWGSEWLQRIGNKIQ